MTSRLRFWCMSLTLMGATAGFHLLPHGRNVPLLQPLSTLPLALGEWQGVETPIDENVIKAIAVDEYLSRTYRGLDGEPMGLYIGYYKSQRTGDSIHSPQNCLPGTGWQMVSSREVTVNGPDGSPSAVNQSVIQKGLERQLVLYWFQTHHRTEASDLYAKIALVINAIRLQRTDSALIRINTPAMGREAEQREEKFASAILARLDGLLP